MKNCRELIRSDFSNTAALETASRAIASVHSIMLLLKTHLAVTIA